MKSISLSKGKEALIDDEDFGLVSSYAWHALFERDGIKCYAASAKWVKGQVKTIRMHRLIVGAKDGQIVDHINHDALDNRRSNLRLVTQKENLRNRRIPKHNKSGFIGVAFSEAHKKWRARIKINNKEIHLGLFSKKEDAIRARVEANKKYDFHINHGLNY